MSDEYTYDEAWAADTVVSMPEPPESEVLLDFGGIAMTTTGIAHNITRGDIEENYMPSFAPDDFDPSSLLEDTDTDLDGGAYIGDLDDIRGDEEDE